MKPFRLLIFLFLCPLSAFSIEERDSAGFTALHTAAEKGQLEEVRRLIAESADIETVSNSGYTPLISASLTGHTEVVLELIRAGAKVNFAGKPEAYPPLHQATQYAHFETTKALIENGADVNLSGPFGATPLCTVLQHPLKSKYILEQNEFTDTSPEVGSDEDRLKIIRLLIDAGAEVNAKNDYGNSPLNYLAINWDSSQAAEILLKHGANIEDPGAPCTPLLNATIHRHYELAEYLVKKGADVTATYQEASILHYAILLGAPLEMIQLCIDHGADVNALDWASQTPASMTVSKGRTDILKILYEADRTIINHVNSNGASLLHGAAGAGHLDMVQFLLDKGLKDVPNKKTGVTALHAACSGMTLLKALKEEADGRSRLGLQHELDIPSLLDNYELGDEFPEIVRLLIEKGSDINLRATVSGASPLDFACNSARSEIVRLLVDLGADFTTHDPVQGILPIHRSADLGDAESVRLFMEKGVSPEALTRNGLAPIHFPTISRLAGQRDLIEAIKALEDAGADLDRYSNSQAKTPLYCALQGNNLMVAEYLLSKGVSFNSSDWIKGESVYEAAQQKANKPFVAIMSARLNMSPVQGFYSMTGNEDGIIAEIGSDKITISDVIQVFGEPNKYFKDYRLSDLKDPNKISTIMDEVQEKLLANAVNLVATRLMAEHAEMTGRSAKKYQIENAKRNLIEASGLSPVDYYTNLPMNDWSIERFNRICEWWVESDIVMVELLSQIDEITEPEIEKRYNETKSDYLMEPKVRLQLISVRDGPTLATIRNQLDSGTEFSELAKKYSTHESSVLGGDLGWLEIQDINKQFLQSMPELKKGIISSPVKMGNSHYLIRISDKEESAPKPLEEVHDSIRGMLLFEALQPLRIQLLKEISESVEYTSFIDLPWRPLN